MLYISIACLIVGIIIMIWVFTWQSTSVKNPESYERFKRWRMPMMVAYLLLFMAAAVLFLIY